MIDMTGTLPGHGVVYPRRGLMREVADKFKQRAEWSLDDLAASLGRDGRHIYGVVFGLRRRYGMNIRTVQYSGGGPFFYRLETE